MRDRRPRARRRPTPPARPRPRAGRSDPCAAPPSAGIRSPISKPVTSAAIRTGYSEASNASIQPTPLRPETAASHVDGASSPMGVTAPSPVMTTRRIGSGDYSAVRCGRAAPPPHAERASRSSGRPTSTPRSRSRRWRRSSSASCPRGTSGSTSRSGTASAACSRTAPGELRLWSRNARPLLRYFPELAPLGDLLPPRSCLDGEIVIVRDGVLDFDAMQTRLHPAESRVRKLSGEIPATFVAFDVLVWDGEEHWPAPLSERRATLERVADGFVLSPASLDRERSARVARLVRGDRPRRRDREAARRALPRGRAHRRRQGEAGEDGRLRRRRRSLEGATASGGSRRSCSACSTTTASSTTSARPRSPRRGTTRSPRPCCRSSRTRRSAASPSRTAGAAASSRRLPSARSSSSRCATTRCRAGASATGRSCSGCGPTRTRAVHVARAPSAARAGRPAARAAARAAGRRG